MKFVSWHFFYIPQDYFFLPLEPRCLSFSLKQLLSFFSLLKVLYDLFNLGGG